MIRRPPRSTRTDTLLPYTTRFRSDRAVVGRDGQPFGAVHHGAARDARRLLAFDQHVGLVVEIDRGRRRRRLALAGVAWVRRAGGQTVLAADQRAPFARAVPVEPRHIARAIVEAVGVRSAGLVALGDGGDQYLKAPW